MNASLYIHIPWCILKCPYCDFNSHKSPDTLPEETYINALIKDLKEDLQIFSPRPISSIFIGGGTPSLFSPQAYESLFNQLHLLLPWETNIEITLEANPGTVEQERFKAYHQLGINRLSLGIQSFNPAHLKALGRIHDEKQAMAAIESARYAGFDNINLDIMHGLPGQSVEQGLEDLSEGLRFQPEHLSWYQLTLEPNTHFYKNPPTLPNEDDAWELEKEGLALLKQQGFERYEISAFSQSGKRSKHNLNYWLYGDYFGIGAGAHGKLTLDDGGIYRTQKQRQPQIFLSADNKALPIKKIDETNELIFEFILNTSRLHQPIPFDLFTQRTRLPLQTLLPKLQQAHAKQLILLTEAYWEVTSLGRQYTNDLQALFLPEV